MTALSAVLRRHPKGPCDAIQRIEVAVEPSSQAPDLRIRFVIEGEIGRLRLPMPESPRRRDGLWQHTCFEAFCSPDASDSYYEFNFTPSLDWAAYRFSARRSGPESPEMPAPPFIFQRNASRCELTADIPIPALPDLAAAAAVRVGLAAVIESEGGNLSWWALAHAGDQPDFHDPSTFLLRVAPA